MPGMDRVHVNSVVTLLRYQGGMTKEAAQLLMSVSATWAGFTITLECGEDVPFVAGEGNVHVVLCGSADFMEFVIRSPTGLVRPPPLTPQDPVFSSSLLRAISGGASLSGFEFSCTVFPEADRELAMPLPAAAKPEALTIAHGIWSFVVSKVPAVVLADHTDKDSMGNTNLGSMFKVTSLLMAQGALCKYILCVINAFQLVFLSEQHIVYVGSGIGKTAWLLSTLAQLDLSVYAFERFLPNYEFSAQTLLKVRNHPKVHNLKVVSLVYSVYKYSFKAALSLGDISEMKSARGVQGFVRYWGPQNGGCNDQSKGEYSALLKVFLASTSLRWFLDTYLTAGNITDLLGKDSSEMQQLKDKWYCFKLSGCAQDNSHFPILVWVKKQQFWQQEELEDGLFHTMQASMFTEPVTIAEEVTLTGKRNSTRKPVGIELHCTKTHGCAFVSKHKKVLSNHEKSCRPKPTDLLCKTQGCTFATTH